MKNKDWKEGYKAGYEAGFDDGRYASLLASRDSDEYAHYLWRKLFREEELEEEELTK